MADDRSLPTTAHAVLGLTRSPTCARLEALPERDEARTQCPGPVSI